MFMAHSDVGAPILRVPDSLGRALQSLVVPRIASIAGIWAKKFALTARMGGHGRCSARVDVNNLHRAATLLDHVSLSGGPGIFPFFLERLNRVTVVDAELQMLDGLMRSRVIERNIR